MKSRRTGRLLILIVLWLTAGAAPLVAQHRGARRAPAPRPKAAPRIPTPKSVLGFEPGDDRKLPDWATLVRYFQALAKNSDRVQYHELGKTTLGAPFIAVVISSPQNLRHLDRYRALNARLADPRTIESNRQAQEALRDGKTIVLVTSGIHSTEVGGHLTPVVLAYRLATDTSAATREILDRTIVWLVPSLNPDGVTIVARWYAKTLGTPAEGSEPPELYHHYAGHDDNRDWYAFTQVETQLVVDSIYDVWHPQIVHDIHQQGRSGARIFLPPYLDPVEPNVDPLLIDGVNALGSDIAWALAGQGKTGISINALYDAWTPARAFAHYHGAVRILSETASA
ncbi:MAG TPA: M14 family zinc carboxypeptidase, partial [Gemmatimonadales bacterium]|nr:M14 family zinc carboxypeptidase [Gemmatimonadales bacterium]